MVKKIVTPLMTRTMTIDKKTLTSLSMIGILSITGFSVASSMNPIDGFVTCTGAQKINQYAQPIALFIAVVIFIVGIMMTAFEAYAKKYGHAVVILLFALVISGLFWGAGKALKIYSDNLQVELCKDLAVAQPISSP